MMIVMITTTSRLRRFHGPHFGFSYYNNYYTNSFWYSHNPYNCGVSIYYGYNFGIRGMILGTIIISDGDIIIHIITGHFIIIGLIGMDIIWLLSNLF